MIRCLKFVLPPVLSCLALAAQAGSDKLNSVYTEPLPQPKFSTGSDTKAGSKSDNAKTISVHGILFGHPFVADEARINSYCFILKQKHKAYARVVLNFRAFQKVPEGQEFFSRGALQPRIEVCQRLEQGDKLRSKSYNPGDDYALHVKFAPRKRATDSDTTSGAINLRFAGGDYVSGTFVARQSPRLIWDDEAIAD